MFFLYSFIGFLIECFTCVIKKGKIGSGILYGPWTPIYGIGGILILLISRYLFNILKVSNVFEIIIVLIVIMMVLTFIEWLGGILIEKIFHVTFWDYRKFKFNFGKYISLEMSLIWLIGSIFAIYVIQPILDRFINLIPGYITYLLIVLIIIDVGVTFINGKTHK